MVFTGSSLCPNGIDLDLRKGYGIRELKHRGKKAGKLTDECSLEEIPNGFFAVCFQKARSRTGKMDVADDRLIPFFALYPFGMVPVEPGIAFLIENMQGFVAKFTELGPPSGTALDGFVIEYLTDHVNFLPAVDLIPDTL